VEVILGQGCVLLGMVQVTVALAVLHATLASTRHLPAIPFVPTVQSTPQTVMLKSLVLVYPLVLAMQDIPVLMLV
jgi:hypothetical protein